MRKRCHQPKRQKKAKEKKKKRDGALPEIVQFMGCTLARARDVWEMSEAGARAGQLAWLLDGCSRVAGLLGTAVHTANGAQ